MNHPSPRSKPVSAEDVHIPILSMGYSFSPQYDNYQTTSSPNVRASETEGRAYNLHSSDFYSQDISVLPVETYIKALGDSHTSSALTSASYCDTSLQINSWASETPAGLNPYLVGATYPPPTPAHRISIPSTISSDGLDPTSPHAWHFNAGPLMQTNLGTPWWYDPWPGTGRGDQTTLPSRSKDGNTTTHKHKTERTSITDAKTDGTGHESRTDSVHPSPPRKKEKPDGRATYQEISSNSNASALTIDLPYSSDSATTPMPLEPDVSFDPAETEAQTSPRRRRSLRTAGRSSNTTRGRQSPTPAARRPEQRARNRIAANKCRTKTKAAVAELEATAKAELLRHEQLSAALRSLQAEVFALKSEILTHGACGDGLIQNYLNGSARSLAAGCGGLAEWGLDQASHIPNPGYMQLRS